MTWRLFPLLWVIALGSLVVPALPALPAFAGRPLSTEDAGVAGAWKSGVELGGEVARSPANDQDYAFLFVPIYGLTDRLEFSVEVPYRYERLPDSGTVRGMEDLLLVLKGLLLREGPRSPAVLLKGVVKPNTGDSARGLGSGDTDLGLVAVASKTLPPLTLHANLGYTLVGTAADPSLHNYLLYGLAAEYAFTSRIAFVGEIYAESDPHFDIGVLDHHAPQGLLGTTLKASDRICLDLALQGALEDFHLGYGLIAGVSVTY